jgi:hypothetical protein
MSIVEQVMKEYKWTMTYANNIKDQYIKFLALRNKDEKYSPTDDIDKFWHQHILNTSRYQNYCMKHFGRLVHHKPTDAYDLRARERRLRNTIEAFKAPVGTGGPTEVDTDAMPFHIYIRSSFDDNKEDKVDYGQLMPVRVPTAVISHHYDINADLDTKINYHNTYIVVPKGQPLIATLAKRTNLKDKMVSLHRQVDGSYKADINGITDPWHPGC